jgi:hypothetical protein
MPSTFDGPNTTITLPAPTGGILNIRAIDIYSDWKRWAALGDNSKFLPAFAQSEGGTALIPGLDTGSYFFLRNDFNWRIITTDEDQTANYEGSLIPFDITLPIIVPTPGRTVLHLGLQPITQGVQALLVDLTLVRLMVAGNAVVSADDRTVTVYEDDGITVAAVFSISADGRIRTRTV